MPFISVDTPQLRDYCLGISVSAVRFRVRFSFQLPVFPCALDHIRNFKQIGGDGAAPK